MQWSQSIVDRVFVPLVWGETVSVFHGSLVTCTTTFVIQCAAHKAVWTYSRVVFSFERQSSLILHGQQHCFVSALGIMHEKEVTTKYAIRVHLRVRLCDMCRVACIVQHWQQCLTRTRSGAAKKLSSRQKISEGGPYAPHPSPSFSS